MPVKPLNKRVFKLINFLNRKQGEFAEAIGISSAVISKIKNDKEVSTVVIEGILNAFPNLSSEWLLRGIPPMWKPEDEEIFLVNLNTNKLESVIAAMQKEIADVKNRLDKVENEKE